MTASHFGFFVQDFPIRVEIYFLGAIKEPEAARLFSEMCTALDYLHGIGIVHRDLKCENVLLSSQNQIKLGLLIINAYASTPTWSKLDLRMDIAVKRGRFDKL